MEPTVYDFEIGQEVTIDVSGEHGEVIGRAEYAEGPPQYFILYKCGDGRAVEQWWSGSKLVVF